jgi:hypothetical protein
VSVSATLKGGLKVSDEFTVPLCRGHGSAGGFAQSGGDGHPRIGDRKSDNTDHREVHRSGDEAGWWKRSGIDPTVAARALWLETHPLPSTAAMPTRVGRSNYWLSVSMCGLKLRDNEFSGLEEVAVKFLVSPSSTRRGRESLSGEGGRLTLPE